MHKLTSLEAQRVTSVLDNTLEKLQTLSYFPTEPDADTMDSITNALADSGTNNVKSCLHSLWQLEDSYRRTKESAFSNSNFGGNDGGYEVGEQLHNTTRTLCRLLRKHPIALDILMEHSSSRPQNLMNVCQYLQDLAGITFRRLSTTVEEETANSKTLRELTEKQKLSEKDREGLHSTLEFQRAEKDKEVAMLGQTISKLRAELHDITRTNEIEVANIEQTATENVDNARAAHTTRCEELKIEMDKLLETIKNKCAKDAETENALRKRKTKYETELSAKIASYDTEMGEKQAMIEVLTAKFEKEVSLKGVSVDQSAGLFLTPSIRPPMRLASLVAVCGAAGTTGAFRQGRRECGDGGGRGQGSRGGNGHGRCGRQDPRECLHCHPEAGKGKYRPRYCHKAQEEVEEGRKERKEEKVNLIHAVFCTLIKIAVRYVTTLFYTFYAAVLNNKATPLLIQNSLLLFPAFKSTVVT